MYEKETHFYDPIEYWLWIWVAQQLKLRHIDSKGVFLRVKKSLHFEIHVL